MKRTIGLAWGLVASLLLVAAAANAAQVGSAFTYQGQLDKNGVAVNGTCSIGFTVWEALNAGNQVGSPNPNTVATTATNGLFTVTLDFGAAAFNGSARWLEIAVQGPGDLGYTTLTPRQPITPAPYAMYALGGAGGGSLTLPFLQSVNSPSQTAFEVDNTATSGLYHGVLGVTYSTTQNAVGVQGEGRATSGYTSGVQGWATQSPLGTGVVGHGAANGGWFESFAPDASQGYGGVTGWANNTYGVAGRSSTSYGVYGYGTEGIHGLGTVSGVNGTGTEYGVVGNSFDGFGVYATYGVGLFPPNGTKAGVYGSSASTNAGSAGVRGEGTQANGVEGISVSNAGVYGHSTGGWGTVGYSVNEHGLVGRSDGNGHSGVWGHTYNASAYGGIFNNYAGGVALRAEGLSQICVLQIYGGCDLAEPFDVAKSDDAQEVEAGSVVVIDDANPGKLRVSDAAYDTRVAGVVSGAKGLEPGMVMRAAGHEDVDGDHPVALTGRVWCKVDASYGEVKPGDLLTTSATAGMAMKASDRDRAAGATLGKAMTGLREGKGLVLVLVNLQ